MQRWNRDYSEQCIVLARLGFAAKARIRYLPTNTQGRDLIVGDLHGHRQTLWAALDALGFDPAVDRVISVGDLVDRGPDSPGCLSLLEEPWFHAVKGNHEDLMLGSVRELRGGHGIDPRFTIHQNNGGEWLPRLWPLNESMVRLIDRTGALPHVLVVGEAGRRYHVVHAGFPDGVNDKLIDRGEPGNPETLMWSRRRGQSLRQAQGSPAESLKHAAPSLSTTYFGHVVCTTPSGQPARGLGHVNLETGVAEGLCLSIAVRTPDGGEWIHQEPAPTL